MTVADANPVTTALMVPWLLTLLTVGIGIWRFLAERRQANLQPFLEKQLQLAFEATETVGRLASETDVAEWEKTRITFWRLYWGTLGIVEDRQVEAAMVALGKLVPIEPVKTLKLPMTSLGVPSYELAHAVRDLLLASWNVSLPTLENKRTEPENLKMLAEKKLTEQTK